MEDLDKLKKDIEKINNEFYNRFKDCESHECIGCNVQKRIQNKLLLNIIRQREKDLLEEVERLKKVIDTVDSILTSDSTGPNDPWELIDGVLVAIGKKLSASEEVKNENKINED